MKLPLKTAISAGLSALICADILGNSADAIKSRRAAGQSAEQQQDSATVVDEVHRRVAEFNRSLKDEISRAKTNKVESRIELLIQNQAAAEASLGQRTVTVYGFAPRNGKGDTRSIAELNGRQVLIFASGTDFVVTNRQVKFSGKNRVPGVVVSDHMDHDKFCLLKLDAQIDRPPTGVEARPNQKTLQIEAVANTSRLIEGIVRAVSQAIQDLEAEKEKEPSGEPATDPAAGPASEKDGKSRRVTGGHLVMEDLRLLPGKSPPDCEFRLVLGVVVN